ncbi:hypothetical protein LTR84_009543 [Exophiala bonariae]|uniref:Protein kinase domain-containing protein n=1 Tax=Exophiala bonariae TaxID=1690606 RepID=A0AAV9MWX6_9EURO|nr:hypothetical protein LTR84_009543 [Exophiala bonariae]
MSLPDLPGVDILRFAENGEVPWQRDNDCGSDGRGSYSIVFRALKGNETFAVKDIRQTERAEQGPHLSPIEVSKSEIRLLKVCDHPNVLTYVAAYTNDKIPDHIYIVTQPWADMNLADFVGIEIRGKWPDCKWWTSKTPFDRCCLLFKGLLDGLSYLHSHAIFHKDIKPENILLLGDRPILADFGVSKLYRPNGGTRYTNSTPEYLSPEQIAHESSTPQADVFAMGCCFLHLLSIADSNSQWHKESQAVFYREDTNWQYGNLTMVGRLLELLQRQMKSQSWPLRLLGCLTREMLLEDPGQRLTSTELLALLQTIHTDSLDRSLPILLQSQTLILEDAVSAHDFQEPKISMLVALTNRNQRQRLDDPQLLPTSKERIELKVSVDTGSSFNIISSATVERLIAGGLLEGTDAADITLFSVGGTIHVTRSIWIAVEQLDSRLIRSKFLVLDNANAYFQIMFGVAFLKQLPPQTRSDMFNHLTRLDYQSPAPMLSLPAVIFSATGYQHLVLRLLYEN